MASSDKTAKVTGRLLVTPDSGNSPSTAIQFNIETASFTQFHRGTIELAVSGTKTFTIASFNLAGDPEIVKIQSRDIETGLPKSVLITLTTGGGTQAGLTTIVTNKVLASDLIMGAYDLNDLVSFAVANQSGGNAVEVNWLFGGT